MMKNQKGGALVFVLLAFGALIGLIALAVAVFFSANNTAVDYETTIKAEHKNNQNVLATYHQKVVEAAQVPTMMREDIVKVAMAAIQGRYGEGGSRAQFQMLREQNPSIDPKLYEKVQQIVESGRDEFKNHQSRLIDAKRGYEKSLGNLPGGPVMKMLGFPKINFDDYNIVITEGVEQAFKTGKESGPVQLRPKQD